jgi:hypothetical protein
MAFAPRKENKGIASRRNYIMDGVHTCAFLYFLYRKSSCIECVLGCNLFLLLQHSLLSLALAMPAFHLFLLWGSNDLNEKIMRLFSITISSYEYMQHCHILKNLNFQAICLPTFVKFKCKTCP